MRRRDAGAGAFLIAFGVITFVLPLFGIVSLKDEDEEAVLVVLSAVAGILLVIIGLAFLGIRRGSKRKTSN